MNLFVFIGGLIGFTIGRFGGMLVGAFIGWFIGQSLRSSSLTNTLRQAQAQFMESTFAVMGAVCKADGRVSTDEIRIAEQLFDRLHLSGTARESAKAAFNRGKADGFNVDAEVARFVQITRGQPALLQMFLQIQLSALAADGMVHPAEHEMLLRIARGLGVPEAEVLRLEAMLGGRGGASASPTQKLEAAYRVLGVDASASDAELKKAYRQLMSQNHPDKLASKGLPDSMREMAEQKTREITGAYDTIKQARGLP
ncbi:co-chaperone DjlA [Sinimarinibacterium sp. CAU 1509]|uniref:co-chaperone DjlA n=1 Tax=Sinimarinibacterium sp. CAU 1509 TaxID=2562283 RepID=UPI0010AB9276|nr:co-chaperone DjlA [Sinimarinibacterium sp. CAU 1509]TJY65012.1 co-chaperone DjlA [Sinimarinibacterium sp. CAU 1509]